MTTGTQLSCIQIVKDHAPFRQIKVNEHSPRSRFGMPCPIHDGKDDNFHVSADAQFFKCWVCGAGGNARQLLKLLTGQETHSYTPPAPASNPVTKSSKVACLLFAVQCYYTNRQWPNLISATRILMKPTHEANK